MKKFSFCIGFLLLSFFAIENVKAADIFFDKGKNLFNEKKYKEAKFNFEKDIVFNPKNEKSYLYLSKIFNLQEKTELEEQNLNTVILINPKNEEAVYNLAKLKLKESDYSGSQNLIDTLLIFCKNYCEKSKKLRTEVTNSQKK